MISKRAVSSLLFLSFLIVDLPNVVQSAPHRAAERIALSGALPLSTPGQVVLREQPRRGPITPTNPASRSPRGNLSNSRSPESSSPSGSPIFQVAPTYGTAGQYAYSVADGDVNGDGIPDIVVANECASSTNCANGSVSVLLGNGDGTFQPGVSYATGGVYAFSVVLGDVNGDGKLDIVVANECFDYTCTNGSVGVLLNSGTGTFQPAVSYATSGQNAISVAVGDVNNDTYPDLVVTNKCASSTNCTNGSVSVLLNGGTGTFQPALGYATGGQDAMSVAVGDVNGDGKPDLVVTNECADNTCATGAVGVLLGNGDGTFQTAVSYGTGGVGALSVALGDVNADGYPDLAVANECADSTCASGSVSVLLGSASGTFQTAVSYLTNGQYAYSVAEGVLSPGGSVDLMAANEGSNNVSVLLGNGDGTFKAAVSYGTGGPGPVSLAVGDVNGDTFPDLLTANRCATTSCTSGSVSVLLGNGDGTFVTTPSYETSAQGGLSATTGVLSNTSGNLDLVVANQCASPGNCANGSVSVLLGNGDGTFQPEVSYGSGGLDAYAVAVGEATVTGNTVPFLAVANECADTSCASGSVGVLIGNGDGTFQPAVGYATGGVAALSVATGVLSASGNVDLVVANEGSNTVGVLLGNGNGTFQPAVTYATGGQGAYSVAEGVLIAGGNVDLVVANEGSDTVSILLGIGDGTFQPAVSYATGGLNAYSVAVGDVNGDGNPDLVVASQCASSSNCANGAVSVLLGNGDGTFQAAQTTTTPYPLDFPESLSLADFNGDGFLDVASSSGNVLLLGNGDGTFATPITLGAFGPGVVAGNFISTSGQPDLAVSNGGSIAVLVNISTTVESSPNPAMVGQDVTFTATVSGKFEGTVTFTSGSTTLCSKVTVNAGRASCSSSALPVGSNIVTATYTADKKVLTSNGKINETIENGSNTTVDLTSSVNPSKINQPVTFTATINATKGTPTGTVQFLNGTTVLAKVSVSSSSAKYTTTKLPEGSNSITAIYSGDASHKGSTSAPLDQIELAPTTTTLSSSPNPSSFGQAVVFTAKVGSNSGAPPNGELVTFKKGTTVLGTGSLNGGSARFTTSSLKVGTTSVTAVYGGDKNLAASASKALSQVVGKATTKTTLTSTVNPSNVGQPVTFTASVTPEFGGTATGSVTFYDGTALLKTVPLSGNAANLVTSNLARGSHTISTKFDGDSSFDGSSDSLTQTVN